MTPRCGRVWFVTIGTVVLLPNAALPGDAADAPSSNPAGKRREIAADLMAHGINVYVVPDAPKSDGDDLRTATAHWIAHNAITLTAAQPEKPIMLVAFGTAGQLLAALGFSQKASRRPVASYVVVDGPIPKPGAADWPDAPVTYVGTDTAETPGEARQAELRGWTVEKSSDIAATLRTILRDS